MKRLVFQVSSLLGIGLVLFLPSCVEYRDFTPPAVVEQNFPDSIVYGSVKINEFCTGSSPSVSTLYFGSSGDWVEFYNPTSKTIAIGSGEWYVTDDLTNPEKYKIKTNGLWNLPSKGFFGVVCTSDSLNFSPIRPNTLFSLSSAGESIGIFYKKPGATAVIPVDTFSYRPPIGSLGGVTYGRLPNGQGGIIQLSSVTPEASNR